jgi:hypothetical protein
VGVILVVGKLDPPRRAPTLPFQGRAKIATVFPTPPPGVCPTQYAAVTSRNP